MSLYNKSIGKQGEEIVANHYISRGYNILERNFTIQGGELDIIAEDSKSIVFIEVKVIDNIDDTHDYISHKKLGAVKNTIEHYLIKHPKDKDFRIDVAFVKSNQIIEIFENITNS